MIADGDKELCSDLLDLFIENGYRGVVVRNQETAIRTASEKRFDIIILDMKLGFTNGLETYQKIRDFRPDVNIIIVTDNKMETENFISKVSKDEVCTFLVKPLDINNLLKVIQNTLEG
jgi:DNA-binding NtrC family response regulator